MSLNSRTDFSRASNLSQSRPSFAQDEKFNIQLGLLLPPFAMYAIFCASWSIFFLRPVSSIWSLYLSIRELLLAIEFSFLSVNMVRVESDQWFQDLYRESVKVPYSGFQVHYPPLTAICMTTLSVLVIIISSFAKRNNILWRVLSRLAEVELGIILLRLLLELYSHAPSRFNVLLAYTSLYFNADQIRGYYATFYAPSALTIYFGTLVDWIIQRCRPGRIQLPLNPPRENLESSVSAPVPETLDNEDVVRPRSSLDLGKSKGKNVDEEPWRSDPIGVFTTDIRQRVSDSNPNRRRLLTVN